ncbi:GNAT family N-acetyltransferase [Endozoicomonas gorgoniicola]|uniref:GNAT family N-acetyltransferase n=1 Tax=Endozoicomonas gorgoniicola TaxID=1234144 RepID=A0ABT3MWR4_9GAMM|nr:GNAT family N-acetyltransferase [Endozoicomonas gorgoniicola]MCW7553819.1 GNAT family N-acetyltransferase [Endozoicomonas gorgoniicola]
MPFNQIGVYEGSEFDHNESGDTFVVRRSYDDDKLFLKLQHEDDDGSESLAGYIEAISNYDYFLVGNPVSSECHYTVKFTEVYEAYRNRSLGALLMFIIVREVQANGGTYLYLAYPFTEVLGFYIQFGFYPAPEHVAYRHQTALNYRGGEVLESTIPFQEKIDMHRKYSLWRGNISVALELIMKKLNGVFSFHPPF